MNRLSQEEIWRLDVESKSNFNQSFLFLFFFFFFSSKVATSLDPRFKDLKCLPRAEREPVWAKLSELVKAEEPALQPSMEENPEPPNKKTLLLMGSESESDEETPASNVVERWTRLSPVPARISVH